MANPFSIEGFQQEDVDKVKDKYGNTWLHENIAVIPSGELNLGVNPNGQFDCARYATVKATYNAGTVCNHIVRTLNATENKTYTATGNTVWNKVNVSVHAGGYKDGIYAYYDEDNIMTLYFCGARYYDRRDLSFGFQKKPYNGSYEPYRNSKNTQTLSDDYNGWIVTIYLDNALASYSIGYTDSDGVRISVGLEGSVVYTHNIWCKVEDKGDGNSYNVTNAAGDVVHPVYEESKAIEGEFTVKSSDYVAGGHIDIPTYGFPRIVAIKNTNYVANTSDNLSPSEVFAWVMTDEPKAGDTTAYRYGYVSTTGSANSSNGSSFYLSSTSGYTTDATSPAQCINLYDGGVRFKTYGDYRFRVGQTYKYWIVI